MAHARGCMRSFYADEAKACTCGALKPKRCALEFEYVAGGWFREKGVPKGEPARMLHGDQATAFYRTGKLPM